MKSRALVVTPNRSGRAEFLSIFKKALEESDHTTPQDLSRLYNLRCSQIPYCPTSVLLNYAMRGTYFTMDMRMSYYVNVGHAVHHVMQTHLAKTGRFIADYECKECGKKYPLSRKYECCDFPTTYEEVSIDYKGIQGHIDGIFVDSMGRVWIVDYKTCSLTGAETKQVNPGANYKRQVRAYAYLLWKQHGIKAVGCMLVFLPRDNPWQPAIWEHKMGPEEYADAKVELLHDRRIHQLTMKARTVEEMVELSKNNCDNPYCDNCKRSKSDTKKLFTRLLEKRNPFPIKKEPKRLK